MLFNSFSFILIFLPLTLAGFFTIARLGRTYAAIWLGGASLVFYGVWNPRYVPLLAGSILFNYIAGRGIARNVGHRRGQTVLACAITGNLLLLAYFKYADFMVNSLNWLLPQPLPQLRVILPLGISFFTFTQIAYLVDVWKRKAQEPNFVHYLLFVTYFPHLIAGPILHHAEMMPQFRLAETYRFRTENFATGLVLFSLGLFKKVVLADGVAQFVAPVFTASELGIHPGASNAWAGVLAYTFQIYYDFSGYSDMAIGLSWMFGIALPLNFNSPYKATSIVDFWRRWHMTLSRFLRDYLYIPLGGNRHGTQRRYGNLLATMALGGLWHGASWTFVAWGTLHGVYLIVNHAWTATSRWRSTPQVGPSLAGFAAWLVTFISVVVGWVFFRSTSFDGAMRMLGAMAGANGWSVGPAVPGQAWLWCAVLLSVALFLPNSQEFMRRHLSGISKPNESAVHPLAVPLVFARSAGWAAVMATMLAAAVISLPQPTSFLYFNF